MELQLVKKYDARAWDGEMCIRDRYTPSCDDHILAWDFTF